MDVSQLEQTSGCARGTRVHGETNYPRRTRFLTIVACLVVSGTASVAANTDTSAQQLGVMPINADVEVGLPNVSATNAARDVAVSGAGCPAGYLCGQDFLGITWPYSDLYFTNTGLTPPRSGRVTSETFPPPGGWAVLAPIQLVTWRGTYIDDNNNGCNQDAPTHRFRIEFYVDSNGDGQPDNCLAPLYSFDRPPDWATRIGAGTLSFGGTISADEWEFTMRLPAPVMMTSGVFSIASSAADHPGCYFLLQPSAAPEGDNRAWRWYESPDSCYYYGDNGPGTSTASDIHYCFGQSNDGACCFDRIGGTTPPGCIYVDEFACLLQGGRFEADVPCDGMFPACGDAPGACCADDGGCTITTYRGCVPANQACCLPDGSCLDTTPSDCAERGCTPEGLGTTCAGMICAYCLGDLNNDGSINFRDINPFVLYLSNLYAWRLAYPGYRPISGDINCDGIYPSFGDINPFVALLSMNPPPQCPRVCPAPRSGPRSQGPFWGGPGTSCVPSDPSYPCYVVVPGYPRENEPQNCAPDHYDGGCNSVPPIFLPIPALPYTVYGESGTFTPYRDTDWYAYTSATPAVFTMTVRAEFAPLIYVVHAGADGICAGSWTTDPPASGLALQDVVLATHCLPAGRYYFVVTPNGFDGVACGADYKLTVEAANCELYAITCTAPNHTELSPCNDDPNHVELDENRGCPDDPNAPVDPNTFEALTGLLEDTSYVICGTIWASDGYRDMDYYKFTLTERFLATWDVDTEVPVLASMMFTEPADGVYGPPSCTASGNYFWINICLPGTITSFDNPSVLYQPGEYWFMVMPQIDETFAEGLFYGYPCDAGNTQHKYEITLNFGTGCSCPPACLDPSFDPNLEESEPACGPGYNDTYNSGCDAATPPGPTLPTAISLSNDYCSTTGSWLDDPNNPASRRYDHDWYSFTTPAVPPNMRWSMYLYAMTPMTWEIWPANNCAAGPLEGLEMPCCCTTAVKPAQCYPANTTYWLRVFPTDAQAFCGEQYYLALFSPGSCTPCNINCAGATDNDDACGAPDTNEGCDSQPLDPTRFLTFAVGSTYCGRSYASAGYHDPDWFKINLAATTDLRLRLQAEFPCFVGLYAAGTNVNNPSCANYDPGNPEAGTVLDGMGYKQILTACSGTSNTSLDLPGLPAGVYVGVIYPIDYFGNVLTNYYPCASTRNDYKMIVTTYLP